MRKIIILSLLFLLLFLSACNRKYAIINFEVAEYDEIILESVEVKTGEEYQLPIISPDWYEFKGWYLDEAYTTRVDSIIIENDITLYGKYEPSLSIALLGNPSDIQYNEVIQAVEDYSTQYDRIYRVYDTSMTDPYEPTVTLNAIDEAVLDGAKIIILTSGYYHSEATYEAQTKYPEVKFILLDGSPKENIYYSEPYIASNTLTTEPPKHLQGFFAGYSAVYDGYYNLGFLNTIGSSNISSGVGFIAGAYYAAKILNVEIVVNEMAYRNLDRASNFVKSIYAEKAVEADAELIYTFQDDDTTLEEIATSEGIKIILDPLSYNNNSEAILSIIEMSRSKTIELILDSYFNSIFEGGRSIDDDFTMDFSNFYQFNESEFTRINDLISDNSILVPTEYDSLLVFLEELEVTIPSYLNEWFIEGAHTIEDLYK